VSERLIDIDVNPELSIELDARVEADHRGDGALVPRGNRERWIRELLALVGTDVRLTITRWKKRTLPQNSLLWKVYGQILAGLRERCLETGQTCPFRTTADVHAFFKLNLIGTRMVEFLGDLAEMPPTTTKLTTAEFSRYVDGCVQRAAVWQVYVQMPGDTIGWASEKP
jgi:hypothetical protein